MSKKLVKKIAGNVLTIVEGTTATELSFDITTLNADIVAHLAMHGLSQKLGDAAAGKEGEVAVKHIGIVWEGLSKGDWTVRAPAGEKVNLKEFSDKVAGLSEDEQAAARELLTKLGYKI